MNKEADQTVVFLDTNALHYIHLYLMRAREHGLRPFAPGKDAFAKTETYLKSVKGARFRENLQQGLEIVDSLSSPNMDVRVEYSPLSELELMAGRARGKATESAAGEGIPDRMWNRIAEEEISARLITADFTGIRTTVEGLGPAMEEAGIPATVSDPDRTRDVLALAKKIAGLVYLGVVDNIIYANALVAGADYLITRDGYFRKTVNCIRSGQRPYDEVKRELKELIGQITLDRSDNVTLPEAKKAL